MLVELQPAYILHTRPYRDTSLLVDAITPDFGRITLVARGVRAKKSNKKHLYHPFIKLLISFQGKSDLKLLTQIETESMALPLLGHYLFSGFYLNELVVRLIPEHDPHDNLFAEYESALLQLTQQAPLEPVLRSFEFSLFERLGYQVPFDVDCINGLPIEASGLYHLNLGQGFYAVDPIAAEGVGFAGHHLLAIQQHAFENAEVLLTAKRIVRMLLKPLLGRQPLKSRELFK